MITGSITVFDNPNEIFLLLLPEKSQSDTARARYSLELSEKSLEIGIEASDIKRFRSYNDSIINTITAFENIKEMAGNV